MSMFDDQCVTTREAARKIDVSVATLQRCIGLGIHPETCGTNEMRELLWPSADAWGNILASMGVPTEPFAFFPEGM